MPSNKDNPSVGEKFKTLTAKLLAEFYNKEFMTEKPIDIGNPKNKKGHKFDLASKDGSMIVECKCYSWTEGRNTPSAKMSTLNEAVLYFNLAPPDFVGKVIVMKKSIHPKRGETLAEYYLRIYGFALEGITLIEIDTDTQPVDVRSVKVIKEG